MTVDSIDVDFRDISTLSEWLESEKAGCVQRHLEEKILKMLFSQDFSSNAFQNMITQLAWLGTRAEQKPFLERDIIALNNPIEPCGWWKDRWKDVCEVSQKVGDFIADHAVEIAAGAALCATGAGLAYVTGYALSVSVGGVVVAGAGSVFLSEEKANPHIPPIPLPDPRACSKEELAALLHPLPHSLPKIELPSSAHELLITAEGIWANGQFFSTNALLKHSTFSSTLKTSTENGGFPIRYPESDWKTFTYYAYLTQPLGPETTPSHQRRGETALALGDYHQAVEDFGKAIEVNPANLSFYLERGAALFNLGQYEASLEDYKRSNAHVEHPFSVSEFTLGFAKGLPKGTYESGEGLLLFFAEFIGHPYQTSKQVFDTFTDLVSLARNEEWKTIAEALAPEIHQLVTQWDTLPSKQKGELAGYAIGKHGADILVPGALAKIASKSVKSAKELAAACKNLQIAQETLLLETAAGMGNTIKIAEVVRNGQTMMTLGEEVGLSAREIAHLKQTGKLESTINNRLDKLVCQSESEVLKEAIHQNKHIKMVRDYLDKPAKEIQKGINSYEKQIALHKDKIANPIKHCPDWDKLDLRQREALVNKKWPAEIKVYEEQRNVLQSILNERSSNE